jgi:thioredoxin-like negative regulator of GroEL
MKILKFYSDWCNTCKLLSSTIDSIKEEIPFEIEEVDAINNTVMAKQYNIRGVPTMIIVDGEAEVKRHIGNMTADQIKSFITI